MADLQMIGRTNLAPGEYVSPWVTLDDAIKALNKARFTLDPNISDWTDAALFITISVEWSDDGGQTAHHLTGVTIFGNSFDHSGGLPSISPSLSGVPEKSLVRVKLTLNKQARIGIKGAV